MDLDRNNENPTNPPGNEEMGMIHHALTLNYGWNFRKIILLVTPIEKPPEDEDDEVVILKVIPAPPKSTNDSRKEREIIEMTSTSTENGNQLQSNLPPTEPTQSAMLETQDYDFEKEFFFSPLFPKCNDNTQLDMNISQPEENQDKKEKTNLEYLPSYSNKTSGTNADNFEDNEFQASF